MKENKEKMIELLQKGFSYQMVGNIYKISKQRVHQICGKEPIIPGWDMTRTEIRKLAKAVKPTKEQKKRLDEFSKASLESLRVESLK